MTLEIKSFVSLIKSMPVQEHSVISKESTWRKHLSRGDEVSGALEEIFADSKLQGNKEGTLEISRNDLFRLKKEGINYKFIIAVIIWGYERGMRGNHFESISDNIEELAGLLNQASTGVVNNWVKHLRDAMKIKGLGMSTYTKFLYFIDAKLESRPALILDLKVISILEKGVFSELFGIKKVRYGNVDNYLKYLRCIDDLAKQLSVSHGALEMFLFTFALNIKKIQH